VIRACTAESSNGEKTDPEEGYGRPYIFGNLGPGGRDDFAISVRLRTILSGLFERGMKTLNFISEGITNK
jgi:hypothetical protein